jgi:site-specific recombinase XerD
MPALCKDLLDHRLNDSGVEEGKVFRRILKNGRLQDPDVTAHIVWAVVKRCAKNGGIDHLSPHDMRRSCARFCHEPGGELEQIKFLLGHSSVQTTERYIGCKQKLREAVTIDSKSRSRDIRAVD